MSVITVPFLEKQRFGNACFIYCFARAYAEKMNCELQCPKDWVGRKILANATEPVISVNLPQTFLDTNPKYPLGYFFGSTDIALHIYSQHQIYIDWFSRAQVREWLKLKPEYEEYAPALGQPPYSAMHLRRGDYVTDPTLRKLYCEVSDESYERAIEKFKIPQPVLRVFEGCATPDQTLVNEGLDWLEDFLVLRDAAHLLRANSSFSVWASWLGHGKTYSPIVGDKVGPNFCEFAEGNAECTAGVFPNQSSLNLKEI